GAACLVLRGVHAAVGASFSGGRCGSMFSLASSDAERRARAMAEAETALQIGRRIPYRVLVAHLGVPRHQAAPTDNSRDAARRSVDEPPAPAEALGITVALEVIPNQRHQT